MNMKKILLHQLANCHDEMIWTIPIKVAIEGLTPEQATWGSMKETHSIWENVNHLTFWNDRYLQRFLGKELKGPEIENEATFYPMVDPDQADWQQSVDAVIAGLAAWREALILCDEADLLKHARYNKETVSDDIWWQLIANLAVHNAYHIGQFIQVCKQYGIWTNKLH
jgi:uncharacterized damage-inducible protein DinB